MEVEGKETYVNCITIKDFMIQINDTNMALMLTSFRAFPKCHLLRCLSWPSYLKIVLPLIPILPYSTNSLPHFIFLHSTITVQQIITYFTCLLSVSTRMSAPGKRLCLFCSMLYPQCPCHVPSIELIPN